MDWAHITDGDEVNLSEISQSIRVLREPPARVTDRVAKLQPTTIKNAPVDQGTGRNRIPGAYDWRLLIAGSAPQHDQPSLPPRKALIQQLTCDATCIVKPGPRPAPSWR
jgi:hypothetical protein